MKRSLNDGMDLLLSAIDQQDKQQQKKPKDQQEPKHYQKRISIDSLLSNNHNISSTHHHPHNHNHRHSCNTGYNYNYNSSVSNSPLLGYPPSSTFSDSDSSCSLLSLLNCSFNSSPSDTPSNTPFNTPSGTPSNIPSADTADITTRVEIWYPKCAQKSYGSEKRFLCPPPRVSSCLSSNTSCWLYPFPTDDTSSTTPSTSNPVPISDNGAYFKHLHVASSGKSFVLNAEIYSDYSSTLHLRTSPIQIISKPSKKSLKQKTNQIVYHGDHVSLFNRINSQTVRTRYLYAPPSTLSTTATTSTSCFSKELKIASHNLHWTPLEINVTYSPLSSSSSILENSLSKQSSSSLSASFSSAYSPSNSCLLFGSIIRFKAKDGRQSQEYEIVKVEKGKIIRGFRGPVGQLHKIALRDTFTGLYLSNPSDSLSICSDSSFDTLSFIQEVACGDGCDKDELSLSDSACWSIISVSSHTSQ